MYVEKKMSVAFCFCVMFILPNHMCFLAVNLCCPYSLPYLEQGIYPGLCVIILWKWTFKGYS